VHARHSAEDAHLLREAEKIATAVGRMFAGLCEVVLHDLTQPEQSIRAIENNLSGRQIGDSVTELGIARIRDPGYPSVIQNYPNTFPDGRPAKSTSIGIKNSQGRYVAALCLNLDISIFATVTRNLTRLVSTEIAAESPDESLRNRAAEEIRDVIDEFAAEHHQTPRGLDAATKKTLVKSLRERGFLERKKSVQVITEHLGISRATVYNYLKPRPI
jgi:predicted transcriptional regulator YheO